VPSGFDLLGAVDPSASVSGGAAPPNGGDDSADAAGWATGLQAKTAVAGASGRPPSDELSASASVSGSEWSSSEVGDGEPGGQQGEVWSGELSGVIGLQKRGLRGLMEGRRMRERTGTNTGLGMGAAAGGGGMGAGRVAGLGIASGA